MVKIIPTFEKAHILFLKLANESEEDLKRKLIFLKETVEPIPPLCLQSRSIQNFLRDLFPQFTIFTIAKDATPMLNFFNIRIRPKRILQSARGSLNSLPKKHLFKIMLKNIVTFQFNSRYE